MHRNLIFVKTGTVGNTNCNKVGDFVATVGNLVGILVGDTVGESYGKKVGDSERGKAVGDEIRKVLGIDVRS